MVTGFEKYTQELTPFERSRIYPGVVKTWKKKPLEVVVNMKDMIAGVNVVADKLGWKRRNGKPYRITGPRLRKIIHAMRVSGEVPNLIANSKGYFKTDDQDKIKDFIKSCRERANSFKEVADSLETYNFER